MKTATTQKYTFKEDYKAAYPEPACRKANPPCMMMSQAPRLFKKGEVINGIRDTPPANYEKKEMFVTVYPDGLRIPDRILQKTEKQIVSNKRIEARDPWTGGVEWDKIFSLKNLFYLVLLVYLAYLFMKYFLPLAKKSFGK